MLVLVYAHQIVFDVFYLFCLCRGRYCLWGMFLVLILGLWAQGSSRMGWCVGLNHTSNTLYSAAHDVNHVLTPGVVGCQ
jgi:hypothetical protein